MQYFVHVTYTDIEDFEQVGFEILSSNSAPFYIGFELFTYFIKSVINLLNNLNNELNRNEDVFLTED